MVKHAKQFSKNNNFPFLVTTDPVQTEQTC